MFFIRSVLYWRFHCIGQKALDVGKTREIIIGQKATHQSSKARFAQILLDRETYTITCVTRRKKNDFPSKRLTRRRFMVLVLVYTNLLDCRRTPSHPWIAKPSGPPEPDGSTAPTENAHVANCTCANGSQHAHAQFINFDQDNCDVEMKKTYMYSVIMNYKASKNCLFHVYILLKNHRSKILVLLLHQLFNGTILIRPFLEGEKNKKTNKH